MDEDQEFWTALSAAKTQKDISEALKILPSSPPPSMECLDPCEKLEAMQNLTQEEFKKAKMENQALFSMVAKMTLNPST
jgi:hypothetical protein